nr:multidrug resistance-associated protein 5 [Tanacetum cinerariifolium]
MRKEGTNTWDGGKGTWGGWERGWVLFLYGGGAQEWLGKRDDFRRERELGCRSAKTWALNEGESAIKDHYGMVRSYAMGLLESNVGSTVK